MKTYVNPSRQELKDICQRPEMPADQINEVVRGVFEEVREKGDLALKKYTHFFDKVDLEAFEVPEEIRIKSVELLSNELKSAIEKAMSNIQRFHKAQVADDIKLQTSTGVECWQVKRPIERIGIYIPGGSAPLLSTVLMLAIPAQIASVKEVVLCTPPDKNGQVNPAILYAANLCGVSEIYSVGGAQAIAAMTFGTETIRKVSKIFGPGNQFVTEAKKISQQYGISIDMPAGPSELLVLADKTADAEFVAADLLSQAEHGPDSQVICVVNNQNLAAKIEGEVLSQLLSLPREEIAKVALEASRFVVIENLEDQVDFINEYAPEHLIISTKTPESVLDKVNNAGSVFLGNYTPESAGDYASGTNHTLPTSGFAKAFSGVNMDAFYKKITVQEISKEGILDLGPTIEVLAEAEQLQGHKNAVTVRLNKLKS